MLEFGKRFTEGCSFFAILDRHCHHYLCRRHGADGADESFLLKFLHKLQESRSFVPHSVFLGNPAVGKVHLRCVLTVPADLFYLLAFLETGSIGIDKEKIYGGMGIFNRRVSGGHNDEVAVDAVADEGLLAV